jgi:hypothetical protein
MLHGLYRRAKPKKDSPSPLPHSPMKHLYTLQSLTQLCAGGGVVLAHFSPKQ